MNDNFPETKTLRDAVFTRCWNGGNGGNDVADMADTADTSGSADTETSKFDHFIEQCVKVVAELQIASGASIRCILGARFAPKLYAATIMTLCSVALLCAIPLVRCIQSSQVEYKLHRKDGDMVLVC